MLGHGTGLERLYEFLLDSHSLHSNNPMKCLSLPEIYHWKHKENCNQTSPNAPKEKHILLLQTIHSPLTDIGMTGKSKRGNNVHMTLHDNSESLFLKLTRYCQIITTQQTSPLNQITDPPWFQLNLAVHGFHFLKSQPFHQKNILPCICP